MSDQAWEIVFWMATAAVLTAVIVNTIDYAKRPTGGNKAWVLLSMIMLAVFLRATLAGYGWME